MEYTLQKKYYGVVDNKSSNVEDPTLVPEEGIYFL
jgi:hypothetical protein